MMKLVMLETVGENCLDPSDGAVIYAQISPALQKSERVELDFTGVRVVASAFLNAAIGRLYADMESDRIRHFLNIAGMTEIARFSLKRVVENSKEYYANKRYQSAVNKADDLLEG